MKEHVELLKERGLPVPPKAKDPKIIVRNEAPLAALAKRQQSISS